MANPKIKIVVKNYGTMTAELYPEMAPKTVENFLKLANEKFFDGLIFHRVIKGFMIQGGGYTEDMTEKERFSAAKAASLGFFEAAGYTVEGGIVTAAPEGGSMSFQAVIAADGTGNHPCYYALDAGSKLLSEIGITLSITDTADASQMWTIMS